MRPYERIRNRNNHQVRCCGLMALSRDLSSFYRRVISGRMRRFAQLFRPDMVAKEQPQGRYVPYTDCDDEPYTRLSAGFRLTCNGVTIRLPQGDKPGHNIRLKGANDAGRQQPSIFRP